MIDNMNDRYAGRDVLITGGLGFIGSNLAIRLVQLGARVTVLDSLIPEFGGNRFNIEKVSSAVNINISDMRDPHSLRILVKGMDYIFHLAGQVSHGDSMREPELDLCVNCLSTIHLVESCRLMNPDVKLVFTSTRQVYGIPTKLPVSEKHPALPIDVNGINKLAAEYYHLLYDRTYGLRSVVLRLTNTYGPRQQIRNDRQGFVGIFIRQALKREKIRIFGTGKQKRDFNFVDDVVDALLRVALTNACYGQVMNLGAPTSHSLLEVIEILDELCGIEYETVPFPEDKKIIDIGDYYGDYSKLTDLTGWQPTVDLKTGLKRTIDFYREYKEQYWG